MISFVTIIPPSDQTFIFFNGCSENAPAIPQVPAFCPSIAPGTGTPSHGGFLYYEVLELLQSITLQNHIIGIDMVEVAPDYDPTGSTAILAAQILLNFLGFIFSNRVGL